MLSLLNYKIVCFFISFILFSSCNDTTNKTKDFKELTEAEVDEIVRINESSALDTIKGHVWLKNSGEKVLFVKYIKTSCSCFNIRIDEMIIQPKDSSILHFEVLNNSIGYFNKSIYIFCNVNRSPLKISIIGYSK